MEYTFEVTGMTCGHCERAVIQAVQDIDSTAEIQVDRNLNKVVVRSSATSAAVMQAIAQEGYDVKQQN